MVLSLASLPLNALLNYIFIFGKLGLPRLELLGAGYATLIVRILLALIMVLLVLTHRVYRPYIRQYKTAWKLRAHTWKELLHIGIPSSLQYGMESAAFSVSGIMIGWLGAMAQAAHQIALNIASLTFMASLGLSLAGSIRVANAYGRNDKLLLRRIGISTMWGGLGYGCVCAVLFILFKNQLPLLFTNNAGVALLASTLLVLGAFFQISDATQAIGVGLLRGTRDVRLPTVFVAIAYWVIGIPAGYFLSFHLHMGASGIWIGFIVGLSVSSVLLNSRFLKKTRVVG
jgi:MATE family multidrug resistance protein